jgi:hypothetical protein
MLDVPLYSKKELWNDAQTKTAFSKVRAVNLTDLP